MSKEEKSKDSFERNVEITKALHEQAIRHSNQEKGFRNYKQKLINNLTEIANEIPFNNLKAILLKTIIDIQYLT